MKWMELCSRNDLLQQLYICRFQIDDIEALLATIQIPNVHTKIISRQEHFTIRAERDGVDVVSVCIAKNSLRSGSYCCRLVHHLWEADGNADICLSEFLVDACIVFNHRLHLPLPHLPELHRLVVGCQQVMSVIDSLAPGYFVDFLIDFKALQIIEFGFV